MADHKSVRTAVDEPHEEGFVMRVPAEGAALQFFTEAMRANTETLKQVSTTMLGVQEEQRETLRIVHETREKVIKLESNQLGRAVTKLEGEIERLERRVRAVEDDSLQKTTRASSASWLLEKAPSLAAIILGVVLIAYFILQATGRVGGP